MDELYVLEASLRQEIDRVMADFAAFPETGGTIGGLFRAAERHKILRMMFDTELSCSFEWADPPSFDELWETA